MSTTTVHAIEHLSVDEHRARGQAARIALSWRPGPAGRDRRTVPTRWLCSKLRTSLASGSRARESRADARLAVHVLPRRHHDHGGRPGQHADAGLPVQLCGDAYVSNFGVLVRSGEPVAIAAYLGKSDAFDQAVATFSKD